MSHSQDSRSGRRFLNPSSFSLARILRRRSSNSSITSNGSGSTNMNTSSDRGHTHPATRRQSEDSVQGALGPPQNLSHLEISISPATTFIPESLGHWYVTPQTSALDLTCEASISLASGPGYRRQDENPSLLDIDVQGREIMDHERNPEIFAPLHETCQPCSAGDRVVVS